MPMVSSLPPFAHSSRLSAVLAAAAATRRAYEVRALFPLTAGLSSLGGQVVIDRHLMRDVSRWALLDAVPDAMFVVSREGRVVFANEQAESLFGYTRSALVGTCLAGLLPERLRADHEAHFARFLANPVRRPMGAGTRLHGLRRDGSEVPVEIALSPLTVDDVAFVLAAVRDVSERVRVEDARDAARREAEAVKTNLETLLDTVQDIVFVVDANGRMEFTNRTLAHQTRAEVVGTDWLSYVPEVQRPALARALRRAVQLGESSTCETSTVDEAGVELFFSSVISPIRHDDGARRAVVVARDVTDKRRMEGQLLAAERMAALGMVAAGVAHEINNPLVAVLANLEVVADELTRSADVRVGIFEALRDARDASERIRDVARDLKLLARSEADSVGSVDLRRVLEYALRMARTEIRHRARVVEDFVDVALVQGNESRLGQVVLNLVMNAAQAIPEGRAGQNEIRVTTRGNRAGFVVLEISDTGVGMSKATVQRLFEPFFTTKDAGVGTGLGLAICQRIVAAHGGRIEVESEVGRGSTFRVFLPAAMPTARLSGIVAGESPARAARPDARILVIDDDDSVCAVITSVLAAEHEVVVETRAVAALARLEGGESFDLILCDMMMPDVTGAELYERLELARPELVSRVVLMSGGAFTPRARELLARARGARLEKPFDASQLRRLVVSSLV
jgi:PAS domain S-box-containing protein